MNFLIIGATSFIGPAVLEKILLKFAENGSKVSCLVRSTSDREKIANLESIARRLGRQVRFVTGNLLSSDSLVGCLVGMDRIIYLVDLKNTEYVKNLLDAVVKTGVKRTVFVSSTSVLVPFENSVKKVKLESENLVIDISARAGFNYTILRPTMIYGSKDDRNYSKMLRFIKKRGFFVMFGNGENLIQPIFIDDVAVAIASVIENPTTFQKTYELCGKGPIKYKDMLFAVKGLVKKPFKIIRLPLKLSQAAVTVFSRLFPGSNLKPDMIERMQVDKTYSYENASHDFGFSPVSFAQGIESLIRKMDL